MALELASDRPSAILAARLEDVAPDGASTLVSYGLLNLQHRDGHEHRMVPLEPGRPVSGGTQAQRHRARLPRRPSHPAWRWPPPHWPIAWPAADPARLTVRPASATLTLPARDPSPLDATLPDFAAPEEAEPEPHEILRSGGRSRTITEDPLTGTTTVTVNRERASYRLPALGLTFEANAGETYSITEAAPNAARAETQAVWSLTREGWQVRTETAVTVTSTETSFTVTARILAFEGSEPVFARRLTYLIGRPEGGILSAEES